METIAQEAKRLLEPIPEDQFTTTVYEDRYTGKCCSMGHINKIKSGKAYGSDFEMEIRDAARMFLTKRGQFDYYGNLVGVNDGQNPRYPQSTPKQRVMALFNDMIAAGL